MDSKSSKAVPSFNVVVICILEELVPFDLENTLDRKVLCNAIADESAVLYACLGYDTLSITIANVLPRTTFPRAFVMKAISEI